MTNEEIVVQLTAVDSRSKSNTKRLDKVEQDQTAISKLVTAVEVMAKEQSHLSADVKEIKTKVDAAEAKPAKRLSGIVDTIVEWGTLVVLGMIAYHLGI